ncbi:MULTISPECIES: DndE family protein [Sphingobacterium]|uniref:DndE family protein n=1 Tax=Sphingobacterium populi TaxID=1812824 RepID=A0ABW5UFI2_9SPHI|nr:DndE family protein [Sphingobacterium sp. CFCC 11742]
MFNSITTSEKSREIISHLTNKLSLGAENVIARIAFAYSLSKNQPLNLKNLADGKGKLYPAKVLFGDYQEVYLGMLCELYNLKLIDHNLPKYVKLHIDHGLEIMAPFANNDGYDFLIRCVEEGLAEL